MRLLTRDFWACLALTVMTLAAYSGVGHFEFVLWDDPQYPQNIHLRDGFTAGTVKWAFTTVEAVNWHPLTWLSHLLDYQLYGPQPGPDHVTSLMIHVLATLMLFIFLRRATGTYWRSALVAFIFALHPLHVESVAWISERKDVLCAFFWFLTSWLWVRYAERPSAGRYLLTLIPFFLGVLSKPMIVSLPIILLLLDYWPLRRRFSLRLLLEKIPFLLLAALSSLITWLAQRMGGAAKSLTQVSVGMRVENALISYCTYIGKTFWPTRLSFFYLFPAEIPIWQGVLAGSALLLVTVIVLRCLTRLPWLAVGWFWFLITLLPVIGLIQVGSQARADRYMYIPMVGLTIMLAWGAAEVVSRWPATRLWIVSLLAAACLACIPATWIQSHYWENSIALFSHATEVTTGNNIAWHNLGAALQRKPGRELEALAAFDTELKIEPRYFHGHNSRGEVLWKLGRKTEAIAEYQTAIRLNPGFSESHLNYAEALADQGNLQEAVAQYAIGLTYGPGAAKDWYNRGLVFMKTDQVSEAISSFEHALLLEPGNADADYNIGLAMDRQGHWAEAVVEFDETVRLRPDYADAWGKLGEALINSGRFQDAVGSLRHAIKLNPRDALSHQMLAFAIASNNSMPDARSEAIAHFREAIRLAPDLADAQESLGHILAQDPATAAEANEHLRIAQRLRQGKR